MLKDDVIKTYEEILNDSKKRFPRNFWEKNSEKKARIIFKYLFEDILKWNKKEIIANFSYEIVSEYKLTTPYTTLYGKSKSNLLKNIYPKLIKGQRVPTLIKTRKKMSIAHKNMSKEKRDRITKGSRENRYCEEYAKKLSDTKLGEVNPNHKLREEQVKEIKKLWTTNNYSTTILGEKFGVKRQTIADIVYGRTWKQT